MKQLPEVKLIENQLRHQTEVKAQREVRAKANDGLHDKHPTLAISRNFTAGVTLPPPKLICRV